MALVGGAYLFSRVSDSGVMPTTDRKVQARRVAMQAIEKELKTPATAKFGEVVVIDTFEQGDGVFDFLVKAEVDAQNLAGAIVRYFYLIIITLKDADPEHYWWRAAVGEASRQNHSEWYIDFYKKLYGWGEPQRVGS